MGKNKREKITYEITLEIDCVTTNGFVTKIIDDTIHAMIGAFELTYSKPQTDIKTEIRKYDR